MLAASLAMALGTILIRFTCTKSDPVAVTGWHMVLGSVPLIISHCLKSNFQIIPDWSIFDWGLMSFASVFGGAVAYGLFFYFANNKEITGFSTLAFFNTCICSSQWRCLVRRKTHYCAVDRSGFCSDLGIFC